MIATPETGVDSIALTYSLMDPLITVLRPISAFITASAAGILENLTGRSYDRSLAVPPDKTCLVDGCCDGVNCSPEDHKRHHSFVEKFRAALHFGFAELMDDLAKWFVLGIFLAGLITAIVPDSFFSESLGSGIWGYLGMLAISLPMYVCATLSTPIAAALVLKGLSPGAALVLLLAGPATNMATITMVGGLLGRRTLFIYLSSIVACTLAMAYVTDALYAWSGISAKASALSGSAEIVPEFVQILAALALAFMIVRVYWIKFLKNRVPKESAHMEPKDAIGHICDCGEKHGGHHTH